MRYLGFYDPAPMRRNPWNPVWVARRLAYKLYEHRHPEEPWLAQGTIAWLDEHLPREGVGIEWGSGRSTQWFARRLRHLTSVESDSRWHTIVSEQIAELPNVDYLLRSDEAGYVGVVDGFDDESVDFVLVDGDFREACIRTAIPKLKPGGLLAVDNTDWLRAWPVPPGWAVLVRTKNVMTETTVWQKPPL